MEAQLERFVLCISANEVAISFTLGNAGSSASCVEKLKRLSGSKLVLRY